MQDAAGFTSKLDLTSPDMDSKKVLQASLKNMDFCRAVQKNFFMAISAKACLDNDLFAL